MNERAQTTVDLLIAILLFITVITGAIIVVTQELNKVDNPGGQHGLESQKLADHLSKDILESGGAYELDKSCTRLFFDKYQDGTIDNSPPQTLNCEFSTTRANVQLATGMSETSNVYIAIQNPDGTSATIDSTTLTINSKPSGGRGKMAKRVVAIDGEQYELVVVVW